MMTHKRYITAVALAAAAVSLILTLPSLGLTRFHDAEEPREATTAVAMLGDGGWLQPEHSDGYTTASPPLLQYIIAAIGEAHGHVCEYVSRLPSAIALCLLVAGIAVFMARRRRPAAMTAVLMVSCVVMHRAAMRCSSSMLFAALYTAACLSLYTWYCRGAERMPWKAALAMAGAVLTGRLSGAVLPVVTVTAFALINRERVRSTLWRSATAAVVACIPTAAWYILIVAGGGSLPAPPPDPGEVFAPSPPGPASLLWGWLPWIVLALFALTALRAHSPSRSQQTATDTPLNGETDGPDSAYGMRLFLGVATVAVIVACLLPSYRRHTGALPCFAFTAMLMGEYLVWAVRRRPSAAKVFAIIMAVAGAALTVAVTGVIDGWIDAQALPAEHPLSPILLMLRHSEPTLWQKTLIAIPVVAALVTIALIVLRPLRRSHRAALAASSLPVVALMFSLDSWLLPAFVNIKSTLPMASVIKQVFPDEQIYFYISTPGARFFGANYYLGNTMQQFFSEDADDEHTLLRPEKGVAVVPEADVPAFLAVSDGYRMLRYMRSTVPISEINTIMYYYKFSRLPGNKRAVDKDELRRAEARDIGNDIDAAIESAEHKATVQTKIPVSQQQQSTPVRATKK